MKIKELQEKDVGRWVWYDPGYYGGEQKGRIKSWDDTFIFVVFQCDGNWKLFNHFTAAATAPFELKFIEHEKHCRWERGFMCSCSQGNRRAK